MFLLSGPVFMAALAARPSGSVEAVESIWIAVTLPLAGARLPQWEKREPDIRRRSRGGFPPRQGFQPETGARTSGLEKGATTLLIH